MSTLAAPDPVTETKISILFVDDDAMLLQGLRRMLHGMRGKWDMQFAHGPREALDIIERTPLDVVVSDMRMPEMDGAELLKRVVDRRPAAIRIMLSGYAENEAVLKTVGATHQYLAKPCDADNLIQTIGRSLTLRRQLGDPRLRDSITSLGTLPALPRVYHDFMSVIGDPNSSTKAIADVIERDVALTATVLKLTNSAYFALPTKIADCRQAVQLLGLETMRSLVTGAALFRCYEGVGAVQNRLETLSNDALAAAALVRQISADRNLTPQETDQAGCAALLAHAGVLLMQAERPDCWQRIAAAQQGGAAALDAERQAVGATHAEVGAYLLSLWGFADPVVEAVLHHHNPIAEGVKPATVTAAVGTAHLLISETTPPLRAEDADIMHALATRDELAKWRRHLAEIRKEGEPT